MAGKLRRSSSWERRCNNTAMRSALLASKPSTNWSATPSCSQWLVRQAPMPMR